MATFFLIIVYLAFISLGLPDSLLGVAWPLMRADMNAPFAAAGIIYMIISGGTIISSLASGIMLKKLGVGKITFISTLMTASALLGFSFSQSFIWLLMLAVPLGLGAGSIDAALNNYVAMHYKSYHMSWLHCFWGVGATLGPIIMSRLIENTGSWRNGYSIISILQFFLGFILLLAIPLWDKVSSIIGTQGLQDNPATDDNKDIKPFKIKGVSSALLVFMCYCGIEATVGLWGSSFLIDTKGLSTVTAARWISMYYGGITVGRFLSGFITLKVNNRNMIRAGQAIIIIGLICLILPLPDIFAQLGCILVGLGCAPIYPCMIHETPDSFGKEATAAIIGYQMAFAYIGSTFLPPVLGFVASYTTITIMPFFALTYIIIMILSSEKLNYIVKSKHQI